MQTFLPYPDIEKSARCLDRVRLGKQRVEVLQILNALHDPDNGWCGHPAVEMWRGYEMSLFRYGVAICREWVSRGYKDSCESKMFNVIYNLQLTRALNWADPPWLGDGAFHSTHRAALLFKDPEWYGQFGWGEEPKIEYVWPSKQTKGDMK